jgi:hypothetical protein
MTRTRIAIIGARSAGCRQTSERQLHLKWNQRLLILRVDMKGEQVWQAQL